MQAQNTETSFIIHSNWKSDKCCEKRFILVDWHGLRPFQVRFIKLTTSTTQDKNTRLLSLHSFFRPRQYIQVNSLINLHKKLMWRLEITWYNISGKRWNVENKTQYELLNLIIKIQKCWVYFLAKPSLPLLSNFY